MVSEARLKRLEKLAVAALEAEVYQVVDQLRHRLAMILTSEQKVILRAIKERGENQLVAMPADIRAVIEGDPVAGPLFARLVALLTKPGTKRKELE